MALPAKTAPAAIIASPGAKLPEWQLDVVVSTQLVSSMSATTVATYPATSPTPPSTVSAIGGPEDAVQVSRTRGSWTAAGGLGR